ncbi:MAG: TIGR03013 family PEP-CTERM/XrtA system glycosyltransferase [Xanthomonadales bacterium]|nr:TIGR03013 family PEP-CTERM/XrtA system glycosyltransferase [Xanthomonadales bacterium]
MLRFLRQHNSRWLALLILLHGLLLIASVDIAAHLRYLRDAASFNYFASDIWPRAALFAAALIAGMAALGLYQTHFRERWSGQMTRQVAGFVLGGILLIIIWYAFPPAYIGRSVFIIALLFGFAGVALLHWAFLRLVDSDALRRRVLVWGAASHAATIPQQLRRRADRRGFRVVGFVPLAHEDVAVPVTDLLVPATGPLLDWLRQLRIDEIVVGVDDRRRGPAMDELLACKLGGVEVTELATFFERESGRVELHLVEPSWLVYSDGFHVSPLRRVVKRAFDLVAASAVLLLAWPLMLLVAIAIRLESGRGQPILYRQQRVGQGGTPFMLVKFRSMRTDAERDGVARWASQHDDRVTRVGHIIRKARLDELPQLANILRGDMSLVGPRPERPEFVAGLARQIRYYELRHCVKPGLAGWAQLRFPYGASAEEAAGKLEYDLWYVKHHGLLLDLLILLQTVEVVLFGRGAR